MMYHSNFIEKTSYKVVLTPEVSFYITKIENNWYITLIDRITTDYTGLGDTGETQIARVKNGNVVFLTPQRFEKNQLKLTTSFSKIDRAMVKALHNEESFFENRKR